MRSAWAICPAGEGRLNVIICAMVLAAMAPYPQLGRW
jgi:hypothetical protein